MASAMRGAPLQWGAVIIPEVGPFRSAGSPRLGYRMVPDGNWSWLRDIVNRLHRRTSFGTVTASDLVPIDDLYRRGLELMSTAEQVPPRRPLHDSVHYRDGLMLAMAAATLIRLGNFARIRVDDSLLRTPEGFALNFPPEAVKNRQPIE
ncbi:MAG: hypothetical protein ACE1Z0_00915, partial [Acidimicrobiia bacterium]